MIRSYAIRDNDGCIKGAFEFDDVEMAKWICSNKYRRFNVKRLLRRCKLDPSELYPDGTGKTPKAELAAERFTVRVRTWLEDSPSNAAECFFKIQNPLAKINGHFYMEQVIEQMGRCVVDAMNKRKGR